MEGTLLALWGGFLVGVAASAIIATKALWGLRDKKRRIRTLKLKIRKREEKRVRLAIQREENKVGRVER